MRRLLSPLFVILFVGLSATVLTLCGSRADGGPYQQETSTTPATTTTTTIPTTTTTIPVRPPRILRPPVRVVVGWRAGQPVTMIVLTVQQIRGSPAFQLLLERREQRVTERAAQTRPAPAVAAGGTEPTDFSAPTPPPGQIEWRPEVERWRSLIAAYFTAEDVEHALAVIRCESLGDPDAYNPAGPVSGLFQHRDAYWAERSARAGWAGASIFGPEANTAVAAWLVYRGGGWQHWSGRAWGVAGCEEYACEQGVC